jgi:hypothetical protein
MFINRPEGEGLRRQAIDRSRVSEQPVVSRVLRPDVLRRIAVPGIAPGEPAPPPTPTPVQPPPVAVPASLPAPIVPPAPNTNPFAELPYPAPGDRIKADDFKKLSQSLRVIADMAVLSGQLFGRTFGEAKVALAGQGYAVARVLSVFGSEPGSANDPSFDGRRVVQVLPAALGENAVLVMVTEAVETRRFAPNFTTGGVNYTYRQAVETMRSVLGEAGMSGLPMGAPNLLEKTLAQATREIG